MTPYFFVYLLVAGGILICFINDVPARRFAQKLYFAFIIIALAGFAGARSNNVDRDYLEYSVWFDAIAAGTATPMQWFRDPTFALFCYIASVLHLAFSAVAFFYALLGLIVTRWFATLASVERWATLLFYLIFCQYYLVGEMTEIRSAVAIPLMAVSLYFACSEKRTRAIVIFLLALLFHFSVIVAFPVLLLLLAGVKFRSRVWIYSLVVFGAVVVTSMDAVTRFLSGVYRASEFMIGERPEAPLPTFSWYALAHLSVIAICVLLLWSRLSLHQRVGTILCGLGLCLFQVFLGNPGLAVRLLYVFDVYWMLLMVIILEKLTGLKRFVYIAFLLIAGLALYIKSFEYVKSYSMAFFS